MDKVLAAIKAIVGERNVLTEPQDVQPSLLDWRGVYRGETPAVVRPATTDEVSAVLRYCNAEGIAVVPQGGNTGLCAGGIPDESGEQIVLSLGRMNRIRNVDADDFSMVAEAGCVLKLLQDRADAVDRLFALSLGAEGSCQIGGNLSTNAGGINVLRYGTARDQVLGLEVVLADGTIIDGLRTLRKNTAGYDLKHLFIGSEGTLGIITAASLKLFPRPRGLQTALVAIEDAGLAVPLLAKLRGEIGDRVEAFELISSVAMGFVERHIEGIANPLNGSFPWYVLFETSVDEDDTVEAFLAEAIEERRVLDAVIAKNASERAKLWHLRHSISEAEKPEAPILKHDIAVPVGRMGAFLDDTRGWLAAEWPDCRLVAFGHVGDGNLHYNVALPRSWGERQRTEASSTISHEVYARAVAMGGTFSAEHGVGRSKRAALHEFADPAALALMRAMKKTLDPSGILNPGKVI